MLLVQPPGPIEEYKGTFVETRKNYNIEEETNEQKQESDTEEDEAKLSKIEHEMRKEFGDDALNNTKTINLHLGLGIRFVKDDDSREEQELDNLEEEGGVEEESVEDHFLGENKHARFFEELEEEELYEEEMSEEEISLSTLLTEDNGEKYNYSDNEEESEIDYLYEEGAEEEDEEEEEIEVEEEVEEEEDDEDEWSIEEEQDINEEQEKEYVNNVTEKIKHLLSPHEMGSKKGRPDSQKKKTPTSKPQSKQSGKEEQKKQKGVSPNSQKQGVKVLLSF